MFSLMYLLVNICVITMNKQYLLSALLFIMLCNIATVLTLTNKLVNSNNDMIKRYRSVKFFYNDIYKVVMPDKHRFPMEKYRLVREKLQQEYSSDKRIEFIPSPLASKSELISTHCPHYVERYFTGMMNDKEIRKTGFPWSIEQVNRSASSVGGTVAAMRSIMNSYRDINGVVVAGHLAGGTHHAFYDYGEGFCIFSDIAVAANLALKEYPSLVQRIAIVDLDVHQGNGNAVLFQNDNRVFTFNIHCKTNLFSTKRVSDVDVELQPGASDEEYLSKLRTWLPYVIDVVKPQLVFYQAGVDVYHGDRLGQLNLSMEGVSKRNNYVFRYLKSRDIPCVVTMGGGYPNDLSATSRSFQDIIQLHANVYKDCIHTYLA